jgi:hypothetical protein
VRISLLLLLGGLADGTVVSIRRRAGREQLIKSGNLWGFWPGFAL